MKRNKLIARFLALHGVRNSVVEDLHAGVTPSSESGDYSDVLANKIPGNAIHYQVMFRDSFLT